MSDFKVKMHQISFSLVLCSRPGTYSTPTDIPAVFKGPTSDQRGREGKGMGLEMEIKGGKRRKDEGKRTVEFPKFCDTNYRAHLYLPVLCIVLYMFIYSNHVANFHGNRLSELGDLVVLFCECHYSTLSDTH